MAGDTSVSIDHLFKSAISALVAVDEPWLAYAFLAEDSDIASTNHGDNDNATTRRRNGQDATQLYDAAREKLRSLESAVYTAGVISSNDILDDISTLSLKYLLIPYFLHRLFASIHHQEERLDNLITSRKFLIQFLESVNELGLLNKVDAERFLDNSVEVVISPGDKRAEKIARYRAEKAAAEKFRLIMERRKTHSSSGGCTGADNIEIDIDEEHMRDTTMTAINSAVRRGLDDIGNLDTEIKLLEYAGKERSKGRDPRAISISISDAPKSVIDGMPSTFKIVSQKDEIKKNVFKPSHQLPTYTVEEWGEIELANMQKKEQEKKDAEIFKAKIAAEENSDDEADRETMEKRSWDNWRDENNKGSGNTMR